MIEFGKTLRTARESKGYTISQLAEMTRMIHQTIEDLENENFTRIAAPIYGRGFVKLYCEAVGLDPKPMVAEFMDIFSGNRELGIKERIPAAVPAPAPAPEAAQTAKPLPEPESAVPPPQPQLFRDPPSFVPASESIPSRPQPLPDLGFPEPEVQNVSDPVKSKSSANRLSRYASPLRDASLPSIPPAAWRIGVLAAVALLVLWLLGLGFKTLYNATSGAESADAEEPTLEETVPEKTAEPATTAPAAGTVASAKREKVDVPPLYVD